MIYLVLNYRHKLSPISSILDLQATPSILLLLDIVFFVLFIYSLQEGKTLGERGGDKMQFLLMLVVLALFVAGICIIPKAELLGKILIALVFAVIVAGAVAFSLRPPGL